MEKINREKAAEDENSTQSHLGAGEHLPVCMQRETEQEKWLWSHTGCLLQIGLGEMRASAGFQQAVHTVCGSHSDHSSSG